MILNWITENYIELIGSLLGILYVILATHENSWCWIMGILNVIIYIFVFFKAGIFGNMSLQVVYLFISIYGWYTWVKGKNKKPVRISKMKVHTQIWSLFLLIFLFIIVCFLLKNSSQTQITNILDALTTSLGIIGTWMQARKWIENWLLWIVADSLSVLLYLSQGLYPTVIFYFILILLAFNGYFTWKKQLSKNTA